MGSSLKVLDLFAGVGGLSLSAARSGFDVVGAVEYDTRAADSHAINFPNSIHICEDLSKVSGKNLMDAFGMSRTELAGLVGGPPCQGFSTIGLRKSRDSRNNLFVNFFKLASEIKPAFYLAENVPGILNDRFAGTRTRAFKHVERDYEILNPIKLSAKDFGAATMRTRVFFIGIRKDIRQSTDLIKSLSEFTKRKRVVRDALQGLPEYISEDWLDYTSSWQRLTRKNQNGYLQQINAFVNNVGSDNAIKRFEKKNEVSGCFGTRHTEDVVERFDQLEPGTQDEISKCPRLDAEGHCPTLRAGTDQTKGSFQAVRPVHPTQPRVITPREAARLQGFPDWFQFHETKWHSFRQIGNSVCPVVGEVVLSTLRKSIKL